MRQTDASVLVLADGHLLGTFTDHERPYNQGAIGGYTEDARVHFGHLTIDQHTGRPAN